jgi:hypothetical protein
LEIPKLIGHGFGSSLFRGNPNQQTPGLERHLESLEGFIEGIFIFKNIVEGKVVAHEVKGSCKGCLPDITPPQKPDVEPHFIGATLGLCEGFSVGVYGGHPDATGLPFPPVASPAAPTVEDVGMGHDPFVDVITFIIVVNLAEIW